MGDGYGNKHGGTKLKILTKKKWGLMGGREQNRLYRGNKDHTYLQGSRTEW